MKRSKLIVLSILAIFCAVIFTGIAISDEKIEIKKGKITSIDLGKDEVVLQDMKTDKAVTVTVEDKDALDKLKAGKIKVGNKVKVRYTTKDSKNIAAYFKKLPGC
jgi:preprotein translocase subunit SecF